MRFVAVSDVHITDKCPVNRKDPDYLETCFFKFKNILDTSIKFEADTLLIGGDIFDYPTIPRHAVTTLSGIIKNHQDQRKYEEIPRLTILVIPGQHDLRYHRKGLDNTPLGNMIGSGLMTLLSPNEPTIVEGVHIVGKGWGEEISCKGDILVTHQMVTEKGPQWAGQTEYLSAAAILHKYPGFKYIISGDNHKPHSALIKRQTLINCGSVMRSSKDQIDHRPVLWIVDTENEDVVPYEIKVLPAKDVFDFAKIAIEETKQLAKEEAKEKIDAFVKAFDQKEGEQVDFKTVVKKVIADSKPKESVINIINAILEKVG